MSNHTSCPSSNLEEIVMQAIDNGLDCLGQTPKKALLFHLEKEFKFNQEQICQNVAVFQHFLEKFFGSGYQFLDSLFCQYLAELTNEKFDGFVCFVDCVNYLYEQSNSG